MFCFAGRRENMELQVPLMRRILQENPDTQYHIWDLARNSEDSAYLHTISGPRILIKDLYRGSGKPWQHFNDVYKHYSARCYQDCLFVKLDDDVVFIETDRFSKFVNTIDANRGTLLTAQVINNGACTPTNAGLWAGFEALAPLPLLDVHLNAEYALMSHDYLFDHYGELIGQPVKLVPLIDWLSINLIGYDYEMAVRIATQVGTRSPTNIAGRQFPSTHRLRPALLGDEGMANTLPRAMLQGFLAGHLNFGPQADKMTDQQLAELRQQYAAIGQRYLAA